MANNTPIVATIAPVVRSWAERHGVAPSHRLMPLSFAAIVGGVVTTIGTAPNLVVSGLLAASGHEPFGLFTVTAIGLPLAFVAVGLMVGFAP